MDAIQHSHPLYRTHGHIHNQTHKVTHTHNFSVFSFSVMLCLGSCHQLQPHCNMKAIYIQCIPVPAAVLSTGLHCQKQRTGVVHWFQSPPSPRNPQHIGHRQIPIPTHRQLHREPFACIQSLPSQRLRSLSIST